MKAHICVIGAGPAGVSAALALSRGGASVTMVDRDACPGGVKACGGGLTGDAWEHVGLDADALPAHARAHNRLEVVTPVGRVQLDTGRPYMVVARRSAWMGDLLEKASNHGCRLLFGERFTGLTAEGIATESRHIKCDHVVGADGTSSRVRRLLGLPAGQRLRARQLVLSTEDALACDLDLEAATVWFAPARFGCGYGWSFPGVDQVRVGFGVSAERRGSADGGAFQRWLDCIGVDPSRGKMEAGSIGCGYAGHRFGRVSLVGDAAGLASPVTGEGIAQALISGGEVAKEILDPAYRSSVIPALARHHRRTYDVLENRFLGGVALAMAPLLLLVPGISREAMRRFSACS